MLYEVRKTKVPYNNVVSYIPGEGLFSNCENEYSILIGMDYVALDIKLPTNQIIGVSGFTSKNNWIKKNLPLPTPIIPGEIFIVGAKKFQSGTGEEMEKTLSLCFYDSKNQVLCFSSSELQNENNLKRQHILVCKNVIFSILNDQICQIWINLKTSNTK